MHPSVTGLIMAGVSALLSSWLCACLCHKVRQHTLWCCSLVRADHESLPDHEPTMNRRLTMNRP